MNALFKQLCKIYNPYSYTSLHVLTITVNDAFNKPNPNLNSIVSTCS